MKAKMEHKEQEQRTFALASDAGDEVVSGPADLAGGNGLVAASFTTIGASEEGDRGPYA